MAYASTLPLHPLFVNRARELDEIARALDQLARGRRRHLALLGLRRIGKTMLLDEVRRRHPNRAIVYLALDEIVTTPEDFARSLLSEMLRAGLAASGRAAAWDHSDVAIEALGQSVHPDLAGRVRAIVGLLGQPAAYGALLVAVMRFPAEVARILDVPILVMLDEFQEIVRLRSFPNTTNLLGTFRAALDRPGKVAYIVSGSRVTALRHILADGESPLFTRFEQIELGPFVPDATHELATRIWDDANARHEPDAVVRLHRLTGGWPFYVQAVAARADQIARAAEQPIQPATIDIAFQHELIGRGGNVGQQCRYLLETALRTDAAGMRNTIDAVLRQTARYQPIGRPALARRLGRHHSQPQIYRAVNQLIENDFLIDHEGLITLIDPVLALWLALEPARRDPDAALGDPTALRRLLAWHESRRAEDRQEMGVLFQRRVENLTRQFAGQEVEGRLFGTVGMLRLPTVRHAGSIRLDDPTGQHGERPDSFEIDIVTAGTTDDDRWAVEAKHRREAITAAMVRRFLRGARAIEVANQTRFARLWMVAPRGIRSDARAIAAEAGVLVSGRRDIDRLDRMLAESVDRLAGR